MELRIGHGIDVHPLVEGRDLILGGVKIPYSRGLDGHSDADALLHAVCDALLGAIGQGDIGTVFPNTEARWKGEPSATFVREVYARLTGAGWRVVNVDCAVLLEAPKLNPHIAGMKRQLAQLLEVESDAVGIKATTAEKLGFVGRGEGIFVSAVALLQRG